MARGPQLDTERLVLRRWRAGDREPFAALNADPVVMEHFPAPLSREQSDRTAQWMDDAFDERGYGFWAVEVRGVAPFVGFVGLNLARFDARFTPAVEIGWRLAREHWGKGYATEAGRAALGYGFDVAGLAEIVAFAVPVNERSRRVMERLGMTHDPADDFDHPGFPPGHRLRRHVLYRASPPRWAR